MRSPQYKIRLDPDLKSTLEVVADVEGRTIAGLIKHAIELYLMDKNPQPALAKPPAESE